jgi:hypothetical protein
MRAQGRPSTTTWANESASGLISTGFISTVTSTPAASACVACARPTSRPSRVANELSAMFWALNGATSSPSCLKIRHSAATSRLLPTEDIVP